MHNALYLVRHCSATGQEPDAPLTEEGLQQANALAEFFGAKKIDAIICSSYTRAYQSILPLARQRGLPIQTDARLTERVLCDTPRPDWRQQLEATFADIDMRLPGGETSRVATARAVAVVDEAIADNSREAVVLVTHGNLLALLLKHFDPTLGFAEWQKMTNPDVYKISLDSDEKPVIERLWK